MDAIERRGPRLPKKATSHAIVPAKPVGKKTNKTTIRKCDSRAGEGLLAR